MPRKERPLAANHCLHQHGAGGGRSDRPIVLASNHGIHRHGVGGGQHSINVSLQTRRSILSTLLDDGLNILVAAQPPDSATISFGTNLRCAALQPRGLHCVIVTFTDIDLRLSGARMTTRKITASADAKSSRRNFLATAGAAAFSFTIVPRHVLGGPGQTPPSERINVAGIGAGGMGGG